MTSNGILQIVVFTAIVTAAAVPLGLYMARVFAGERTFLSPVLGPVERVFYRMSGVNPERQISQGLPPPAGSSAVAMIGVSPLAKMPEN